MSNNFYDLYFKIKDMEVGNVNDINSQSVELTPIDSVNVGVRDENPEPLQYTYDPEQQIYVPNRQPLPGEPGYAPQGRIEH